MVLRLINHPTLISINEKDGNGKTALHTGEYLNIFKFIILLILLFKASEEGHDNVVHLLINHPTFNSINKTDGDGKTALHKGEYLNIFQLIILFILLFKASDAGHDNVVHLLINHPTFISINEKDEEGQTAVDTGEYLNIIKLIILFIL